MSEWWKWGREGVTNWTILNFLFCNLDRLLFQACSAAALTFVHDFEDDLSIAAMHIWRIAHLADVGAVKGRRHLMQSDGNIPFHNISWPHGVAFKAPFRWRVRYVLVVKHLPHNTENWAIYMVHDSC